jgi:hypothetical protein
MQNNSGETNNSQLLRIAFVGIVGVLFFIGLEVLSWLSYTVRTTFYEYEQWLFLALVGMVLVLQIIFLWFGLNVMLGLLAAFTLNSKKILRLLGVISRLPLLPGKWLLRPCVTIMKWTVVARQAHRSER